MGIFSAVTSALHKIFSAFSKVSQWVLFILTMIVFYDVVLRYVFNNPTIWALEISEYMLVFLGFFMAADIQAKKRHIKMDFFYSVFPQAVRSCLDALFHMGTAGFSLLLLWSSMKMTITAYRYDSLSNSLLETPLFIPYSIIPLAMLMLLLQSIIDLFEDISHMKVHKKEGSQ